MRHQEGLALNGGGVRTFGHDDRGLYNWLEDRLYAAAACKLRRVWEIGGVADERLTPVPVNDCTSAMFSDSIPGPHGDTAHLGTERSAP